MTQPYVAVIKGKVLMERHDEGAPVWLDILTVLCEECRGTQAHEMVEFLCGELDPAGLADLILTERAEQP